MLFLWLGLIIALLLFMFAFMIGYLKRIPEEVHVEDYYYKNKETVYEEVRNDYDYDYAYENVRSNRVIDDKVVINGGAQVINQNVVDMGTT